MQKPSARLEFGGTQHPVDRFPMHVGRGNVCTIKLDELTLAEIQFTLIQQPDGSISLVPGAVGNPTRINDVLLDSGSPRVLVDGDRIQIADIEMCFLQEEHEELAAIKDAPTQTMAAAAVVPPELVENATTRTAPLADRPRPGPIEGDEPALIGEDDAEPRSPTMWVVWAAASLLGVGLMWQLVFSDPAPETEPEEPPVAEREETPEDHRPANGAARTENGNGQHVAWFPVRQPLRPNDLPPGPLADDPGPNVPGTSGGPSRTLTGDDTEIRLPPPTLDPDEEPPSVEGGSREPETPKDPAKPKMGPVLIQAERMPKTITFYKRKLPRGNRGKGYVWVIDQSTSMSSLIDQVRVEIRRSLQQMTRDHKFNMIVFHETARYFEAELVQATDKNKERAWQWIRKQRVKGMTRAMLAFRSAIAFEGVDTVILMTDGELLGSEFQYIVNYLWKRIKDPAVARKTPVIVVIPLSGMKPAVPRLRALIRLSKRQPEYVRKPKPFDGK